MVDYLPVLVGQFQGGLSGWQTGLLITAAVLVVVLVVLLQAFSGCINLYIMCRVTGVPIGLFTLFGMRLRKADFRLITYCGIRLRKAGLDVPISEIESAELMGARVASVVSAMLAANTAGVTLPWVIAAGLSRSGHDPLDGVLALLNSDDWPEADLDFDSARALYDAMTEHGVSTTGLVRPPAT
jgi:uncharacterized protein YqfA (UPF0365 family)